MKDFTKERTTVDALLAASQGTILEILALTKKKDNKEAFRRIQQFEKMYPDFSRKTISEQIEMLAEKRVVTKEDAVNAAIIQMAGKIYDSLKNPDMNHLRELSSAAFPAEIWTREYPEKESVLSYLLMVKGMVPYYRSYQLQDENNQQLAGIQDYMALVALEMEEYLEQAEKNLENNTNKLPAVDGIEKIERVLHGGIERFPSDTDKQITLLKNFEASYFASEDFVEQNDGIKKERTQEQTRSESGKTRATPVTSRSSEDKSITITDDVEEARRILEKEVAKAFSFNKTNPWEQTKGEEQTSSANEGSSSNSQDGTQNSQDGAARDPVTEAEQADYKEKGLVWDRIAHAQETNPLQGQTRIGEKLPQRLGMQYLPATEEMPSGVQVSFPKCTIADYGNVYVVRKEEGQSEEDKEKAFLAMATAARLSGKNFVKLTGSDEFRYQMYLACRKVGLQTNFNPTEEQKARGDEVFAEAFDYRTYWGWDQGDRTRSYEDEQGHENAPSSSSEQDVPSDSPVQESLDENDSALEQKVPSATPVQKTPDTNGSADSVALADVSELAAEQTKEKGLTAGVKKDKSLPESVLEPEIVPMSSVYSGQKKDYENMFLKKRPLSFEKEEVMDATYSDLPQQEDKEQLSLPDVKTEEVAEKTEQEKHQEFLDKCADNLRKKFKRTQKNEGDLSNEEFNEAFLEALEKYDSLPEGFSTGAVLKSVPFVKDGEIVKRKLDLKRLDKCLDQVLGSKRTASTQQKQLMKYLKLAPEEKRLLDEAVDMYKKTYSSEKFAQSANVGQKGNKNLMYTDLDTMNKEMGRFDVAYLDSCVQKIRKKYLEDAEKNQTQVLASQKTVVDESLPTTPAVVEEPEVVEEPTLVQPEMVQKDPIETGFYLYGKDGKFIVAEGKITDDALVQSLSQQDKVVLAENGRDLKDILKEADEKKITFANAAEYQQEIQDARIDMSMEEPDFFELYEMTSDEKVYARYESLLVDPAYEQEKGKQEKLSDEALKALVDHFEREAYKTFEDAMFWGGRGRTSIKDKDLQTKIAECRPALLNLAVRQIQEEEAAAKAASLEQKLKEKQIEQDEASQIDEKSKVYLVKDGNDYVAIKANPEEIEQKAQEKVVSHQKLPAEVLQEIIQKRNQNA
jgi:hypothetical protein